MISRILWHFLQHAIVGNVNGRDVTLAETVAKLCDRVELNTVALAKLIDAQLYELGDR